MLKFRTIKSEKILNKYSMFARVVRTMPLFSIKNTEAWLKFTKLHLNKPNDFCNNFVWTHDTKVETSGHNTAPHLTNSKYQLSTLVVEEPQDPGTLKTFFFTRLCAARQTEQS